SPFASDQLAVLPVLRHVINTGLFGYDSAKTAAYSRQTGYAPVSDGVIHIAFRSTPEEKLIIRRDGRDRCADNLRKARMPVSPWRALPLILVALIMLGAPVAHASAVGS